LASGDESLRVAALKTLGQLGSPKAKPSIEKRFHNAESEKEREAAGIALRMINSKFAGSQ
jgi:HEAT repeat protein